MIEMENITIVKNMLKVVTANKSWGNGYTYQNLTGNKACVACGGGTTDFPFKGDLLMDRRM